MRHGVSMVMVDISEKEALERVAVASGSIKLKNSTIEKIRSGNIKKGNVLGCAETAAILAVKKTPDMIPLCHPISVEAVKVDFSIDEEDIKAAVSVKSVGKTGVEMDALHGLSVALLTIWDMVKSEEKDETGNYPHTWIEEIKVERKEKKPKQKKSNQF
ncbi:MAG: cyclic pyranopterin monophosphate synthase MoaC [Methanophagales archaeon]|nr:cyclic pyranopterin monophosphate synthase MoaC [Methanophagales archaeon]